MFMLWRPAGTYSGVRQWTTASAASSCPPRKAKPPGLRFGDSLVLALMAALASFAHLAIGLTHRSLREQVAALTARERTPRQTSYDLRRLAANGLVSRVPGTHSWTVTLEGVRIAALHCKPWDRVVAPAGHAFHAGHDCPAPLARAWWQLDDRLNDVVQHAAIRKAA